MIRIIRLWIMDMLGFSRAEANGTLVLVLLIVLTAVLPRVLLYQSLGGQKGLMPDPEKLNEWEAELRWADSPKRLTEVKATKRSLALFAFDPNKVSADTLELLGFDPKLAARIVNYREKGGEFRVKADLRKIYGIPQAQVDQLWDYILLPEEKAKRTFEEAKAPLGVENSLPVVIRDLNTATAAQLDEVRGIGPALADRILKWRDRLGGFQDKDQLYEVYGLDSAVVARLKERFEVQSDWRQISVNTDSAVHLARHPYIDYRVANAIVNYRRQHGFYDSVGGIKSIKIISDSLYQKISPYLSIDR